MPVKEGQPGISVRTMSESLALIAGTVSVASAFAYILSYQYLKGYFGTLGCAWAIYLYPPTQLIQTAAPLAVAILVVGFLLWHTYDSLSRFKAKPRWIISTGTAAAALFGIHLWIKNYLPTYQSSLDTVAIFPASVSAGMFLQWSMSQIANHRGASFAPLALLILVAFSLLVSAEDRGRSAAEKLLSAKVANVLSVSDDKGTNYRLARIIPYERALVFSSSQSGKLHFRVIPVDDIVVEAGNP